MAGKTIMVEIVGDAAKFKAATADATQNAKGFGDSLGNALKVAGAATLAVGAIAAVGAVVFSTGAKMEAMDAKAQTVFGDSLPMVKKWAAENAAAMGLTAREAAGLAANMGDLLVPLGFTRDEAAAMSTDIVGLSGALSEWSGGTRSASEVSEILQKALLGERDGLKELGISISDADVKAQLLADGNDKLTGTALAQATAIATQTLILAKSTDAQTAYADGTAVGIRTQHELEASLNEVKETLITALYPVLTKVAAFIAENLPGAIKVAGDVFNWLGKNVIPPLGVAFGIIGKAIQGWIAIIGAVIAGVDLLIKAFQGMATIIGSIWNGVTTVIKGAINTVIGAINGIIKGINSIQVHIAVGPVKYDFNGVNLGYIPKLHSGGIVPGAAGSEVLAVLQAGERVTPAGAGGMGQTIVVNIASFVGSDRDIDRFTDRIALRLRMQGVR